MALAAPRESSFTRCCLIWPHSRHPFRPLFDLCDLSPEEVARFKGDFGGIVDLLSGTKRDPSYVPPRRHLDHPGEYYGLVRALMGTDYCDVMFRGMSASESGEDDEGGEHEHENRTGSVPRA